MDNDPDLKLIEDFKQGDRQSFNRLVLKYQKPILNLCIRLLGNFQDGEDAAQETFVKVYRNIHKFKGDAKFATWIYRIGVNHCSNFRKSFWTRLKKKAVNIDEESGDEQANRKKELVDSQDLPSEALERKRKGRKILNALKEMPRRQRELIVLRDLQDLSYNELCTITQMPLGTIKSSLARARAVLREKLEGILNE
jgi:RNA polymerase sigma-70 factor (ECF subfamily)